MNESNRNRIRRIDVWSLAKPVFTVYAIILDMHPNSELEANSTEFVVHFIPLTY